jgi:hypothetical protein
MRGSQFICIASMLWICPKSISNRKTNLVVGVQSPNKRRIFMAGSINTLHNIPYVCERSQQR